MTSTHQGAFVLDATFWGHLRVCVLLAQEALQDLYLRQTAFVADLTRTNLLLEVLRALIENSAARD